MTRPVPALALLLVTAACGIPSGTRLTPAEYEQRERAALAGAVADQAGGARSAREQERELDRRGRELSDRTADAEHERAELDPRAERLALEQLSALADAEFGLERARRDAERAAAELAAFTEERRPLREAEDALSLRAAADTLLETREELAQLELMYAGSELGEGTAEIVLERTRRRLRHDEERQALAERRSRLLLELELPREQAALALDLEARTLALANAERRLALTQLEQAAARRGLEHDRARLERRMVGLREEQLALEVDRRAAESARIDAALAEPGAPR